MTAKRFTICAAANVTIYSTSSRPSGKGKLSQSDAVLNGLWIISGVCFLLQFIIEFSYPNIISAALVLLSVTITLQYLRMTEAFPNLPVSSFAILGFNITTQLGALIVQTLAWTPLAGNLNVPERTFAWLALYQAIGIAAHLTFRKFKAFSGAKDALANHLIRSLSLFDVPAVGSLWIIGVIGFLSFSARGGETGDAASKFFSAFNFLAWTPFLIPLFYRQYGPRYCSIRTQALLLAAYTLSTIILGLALNVRVVMFLGSVTALLMFCLLRLSDRRTFQRASLRPIILMIIGSFGLLTLGSNFVTAMAIARQMRANAAPVEMIKETIYTFLDTKRLDVYKDAQELRGQLDFFGEYYIANPIIARFVETKFHDNAFYWTSDLLPSQIDDIRDVTGDRVLAILPDPFLRALGLNVDKSVMDFSMGDYFIYLKSGRPLGGFVTGSMLAHGVVIAGNLFPIIYFGICILIFVIWESFVRHIPGEESKISVIAMLAAWPIFIYGLTAESLNHMIISLIRTLPQNILIYLLLYHLTSLIFAPYYRDGNHLSTEQKSLASS